MDTKYCYICVTHVSNHSISWRHFLTVTQEVDVLKPGVQRLQARIANTILRPNSRHCIVQLSIIHIVQLTCHDLSARNTPCLEAMPVIPSQNIWKIQKCNLFALTKMPTTSYLCWGCISSWQIGSGKLSGSPFSMHFDSFLTYPFLHVLQDSTYSDAATTKPKPSRDFTFRRPKT